MKTKIIPFDLETAKKIQSGEVEGKVLDKDNFEGTIITTNGNNTPLPVVIKFSFDCGDYIIFFGEDGKNAKGNELFLEVPDNEPQFKPFDRVLVRNDDEEIWQPRLYEMYSGGTEKHYCQDGVGYLQCIPYEGNEHLVGTNDKPNEE